MKVFLARDSKGYISSYHTDCDFTAFEEAEQEMPTIDISKLQGYEIQNGKLVFNEELYNAYITEKEKEASIKKGEEIAEELALQTVLTSATDVQSYYMRYLYPEWSADSVEYKKDERLMYNDKFYKVLQNHTSQESWTPDAASSLFVEISDPNEEYPEWIQPTHAENAYSKGAKVTYNGNKYVSLIDANVWSPDDYPAGWQLVS